MLHSKHYNYLKIWVIILLFGVQSTTWGQYRFGFEGDISAGEWESGGWRIAQVPPGRWEASRVDPVSGKSSLHHAYDNPDGGVDFLCLSHPPFSGDSLSISFRIRHGYTPSSLNNWQVSFLSRIESGVAKDPEKGIITEGVAVGVNFTGSDDLVKFWKIRDGDVEELCSSTLNFQESVGIDGAPLFRIEWRREKGISLYFSPDPGQTGIEMIATGRLDTLPAGRSLVIRYEYSASRDRMLWLDDLSIDGVFMMDRTPPKVIGWDLNGQRIIRLVMSEWIDCPSRGSFILSGWDDGDAAALNYDRFPDSVGCVENEVILQFGEPIPNRKPLVLGVNGLCDTDGNCLGDTLVSIMRNEAVRGDVVINELMFDPDPPVYLDLGEYVELFNRTAYTIDLGKWRLLSGDRDQPVRNLVFRPGDTGGDINHHEIGPGGYMLLTGIPLANHGSSITLFSGERVMIHTVSYRPPIDGLLWKQEGGWSVESPDPDLTCLTSELWEYSIDPSGGTPGRKNSVFNDMEDNQAPVLLYTGIVDPGTLHLHYSEPVRISPGLSERVTIMPGKAMPDSLVAGDLEGEVVTCYFGTQISDLDHFEIRVPEVSDCEGNLSSEQVLPSGHAVRPVWGSVYISEIMYDPLDGAPEFIELYHPGPFYTDLKDLAVEIRNDGGAPGKLHLLSDHSRILIPGSYMVLTGNMGQLLKEHGLELSGNWVEVPEMPGLPGTGGEIRIADRAGMTVDLAVFRNDMHMDLIDNTRGISLERISWSRAGDDHSNWHSAASIEGYATPGRSNSQATSGITTEDILKLAPSVFSPDNDGFDDLLEIILATGMQGCVASIWITGLSGEPVRIVANNHLIGSVTSYLWNGETDSGRMAGEGLYIVHVRGYDPLTGRSWNAKSAAALVYP